jgi:hypothetical protein
MASTWLKIGIESHNLYGQNHLFMRILHISAKMFCLICEQNGNAKCLVTSFSESKEGGARGRVGHCGTHMPTKAVQIAALNETDRFFTTSCKSYMGHSLRLLHTSPEKDTKHF